MFSGHCFWNLEACLPYSTMLISKMSEAKTGWWLNQPLWKYARQNGSWNPKDRGEHEKYLSCHHLENPLDIRRTLSGLLTLLQHLPSTKTMILHVPTGNTTRLIFKKEYSFHPCVIYLPTFGWIFYGKYIMHGCYGIIRSVKGWLLVGNFLHVEHNEIGE